VLPGQQCRAPASAWGARPGGRAPTAGQVQDRGGGGVRGAPSTIQPASSPPSCTQQHLPRLFLSCTSRPPSPALRTPAPLPSPPPSQQPPPSAQPTCAGSPTHFSSCGCPPSSGGWVTRARRWRASAQRRDRSCCTRACGGAAAGHGGNQERGVRCGQGSGWADRRGRGEARGAQRGAGGRGGGGHCSHPPAVPCALPAPAPHPARSPHSAPAGWATCARQAKHVEVTVHETRNHPTTLSKSRRSVATPQLTVHCRRTPRPTPSPPELTWRPHPPL
jgi:hypothetical protein